MRCMYLCLISFYLLGREIDTWVFISVLGGHLTRKLKLLDKLQTINVITVIEQLYGFILFLFNLTFYNVNIRRGNQAQVHSLTPCNVMLILFQNICVCTF